MATGACRKMHVSTFPNLSHSSFKHDNAGKGMREIIKCCFLWDSAAIDLASTLKSLKSFLKWTTKYIKKSTRENVYRRLQIT